jgi:hypothetical protein
VRIAGDELRRSRKLTRSVDALERELAVLVADHAPALLAEHGCGVLTAAKLIGEIAGIARFATDAKLARIAGSAPIPASSGNTDRHRLDRGGNRQLNCALHRLAVTKGRPDPDTAAYLARKQANGKSRREGLRCVRRHLARRVWRLLQPPPQATPTPTNAPAEHLARRHHDPLQHALQPLLIDIGTTSVVRCGSPRRNDDTTASWPRRSEGERVGSIEGAEVPGCGELPPHLTLRALAEMVAHARAGQLFPRRGASGAA